MRVLVTGANGFVGAAMCSRLSAQGVDVVAAVRHERIDVPAGASKVIVGDLHSQTAWKAALSDVSGVVHLAARAHVMTDTAADPLEQYRTVNVDGTVALARCAASAGVRRFVFVSSVKVHGEQREVPYSERDAAAPQDPYGQSKWEAEQALREIERQSGMDVAIVRPPLVYGPRVGANFLKLMETVAKGLPLPLGSVHNRRSLIFVENLADVLATCLVHPGAAGHTFLVSDGEDVSTPDLIRRLGVALNVRVTLLPVPSPLLRMAGRLMHRGEEVDRLVGSLSVDGRTVRQRLAWTPPFSLTQGLAATAAHYWETHAR